MILGIPEELNLLISLILFLVGIFLFCKTLRLVFNIDTNIDYKESEKFFNNGRWDWLGLIWAYTGVFICLYLMIIGVV